MYDLPRLLEPVDIRFEDSLSILAALENRKEQSSYSAKLPIV